jgi:hypothetical protein
MLLAVICKVDCGARRAKVGLLEGQTPSAHASRGHQSVRSFRLNSEPLSDLSGLLGHRALNKKWPTEEPAVFSLPLDDVSTLRQPEHPNGSSRAP